MKSFIINRSLLFACSIAVVCAALCSVMSAEGLGVFACSLFFILILVLPIKIKDKKIKRFVVISVLLSLIVVIANYIYFGFVYTPVLKYSESELESECVVLEVNDHSAIVYFDEGFLCKAYFDETSEDDESSEINESFENVLPSSKIHVIAEITDVSEYKYSDGGIHARAYVNEWKTVSECDESSLIYLYHLFRTSLEDILDFGDDDLTAFMKAVILGDTDDVSGIFMNKFKTVGMSHVMSVSGMHLMFAVSFLNMILAAFNLSYKKRAIFCIFAAFIFVFISGFAISCIRSFIMVLILNAGIALDKEADTLTSLSVSALAILIFSPYNTFNISFVLSVFATFGLIALGPAISKLLPIDFHGKFYYLNAFCNIIKNSLAASLGANIACIPVFLIVFKQISVISPLVNLILIIPIQIIFYIGFAALILFPLPFVKTALVYVFKPIYLFVNNIIDFCYNIKYTTVNDGSAYFYLVFVLLLVLITGIFLYRIIKSRIAIYYYIGGYFVLCVVLFAATVISSQNKIEFKVVDVGQGSSCFIADDERAVIVDSGGYYYNNLQDELRRSTVKNIELIAITHADSDHVGFIENIINTYDVEKIVYPEFCEKDKIKNIISIAKENGTEIFEISKDTEFTVLGDCLIEAFVEKAYQSKRTANTSALYKFTYGESSICFTGDMSIHQEYPYLDYGERLDCDILVVPHHGSATSLYFKILDLYSPEYSVISVGADNVYGLPDSRTVDRLLECSKVVSTAESSTVIFEIDEKEYKLVNQ